MPLVRCRSCGGEYETISPSGVRYFHACPPLSGRELAAAIASGAVVLPPAAAARLAAAQAHDRGHPPAPGDASQADAVLASLGIARPNPRNENVPPGRVVAADAIIAAGAGVDVLVP